MNLNIDLIKNRKQLYFLLGGMAFWLLLIVLGPIFKSSESNTLINISDYMYFFFEPVCHQIPERSILLYSESMTVCTRCFAIYFGAFIFLILIIVQKKRYYINPSWMIFFSLPTVIDFVLEKFGLYVNIPIIRVITGLIFGVAIIYLILYSILDAKNENKLKREICYGKSEIN